MLQQFNFQEHQVRIVLDDKKQPMFVAKDVATILGYTDTSKAINTHCNGELDDKGKCEEALKQVAPKQPSTSRRWLRKNGLSAIARLMASTSHK